MTSAENHIHPNDVESTSGLWAIDIDGAVRLCRIDGWTGWGTEEIEIDIYFDLPYTSETGQMRYGYTIGRLDRLRRPTVRDLDDVLEEYEREQLFDERSLEEAERQARASCYRADTVRLMLEDFEN